MEARREVPGWLLVVVGWMLGTCLVLLGGSRRAAAWSAPGDVPATGAASPASVARAGEDAAARDPLGAPALEGWTVRELRQLPGVGPSRAVAIARARWRWRFPRIAAARDPLLARRRPAGHAPGSAPGSARGAGLEAEDTDGAGARTLLLADVRGVGPATSAAVAAWLRVRGLRPACGVLAPEGAPRTGSTHAAGGIGSPGKPRAPPPQGARTGAPPQRADAVGVEVVCGHRRRAREPTGAGSGPARGSVHSPSLSGDSR